MSDARQNEANGSHEMSHEEQIVKALQVIHDPTSSNQLRREASVYLEQRRTDAEAPHKGFILASSTTQTPLVKHYGLSLIDHAIRNSWAEYTQDQSAVLRSWVLQLAEAATEQDPPYVTNKVAELWVETAKRSWAVDWMDMDERLVKLWNGSHVHKILVLIILETLSDELFTTEDSVAALRGSDLNRACVEIFIPNDLLNETFPKRETTLHIRYGPEGWLTRLSSALNSCTDHAPIKPAEQKLAVKVLSTLKSAISWVIPRALLTTSAVSNICACLAVSNMAIQLAAIDTLYVLYNRPRFPPDDFQDLVGPMFRPEAISLLQDLDTYLAVDPTDIDDAKYITLKRLSDIVFNLGRHFASNPARLPEHSDLPGFTNLLMRIMKNDSLQVSIPAVHLWVRWLLTSAVAQLEPVLNVAAEVLETCSRRLIRYEFIPEKLQNSSMLLLNEDIETMPERHAFLGNYARFCNQVVELVVERQPIDALYHILGQADELLIHVYDEETPFDPATYTKHTLPWLRIDAQFTVIEAALRGCLKWFQKAESTTAQHQHEIMVQNLQVWCDRLLSVTFEDPSVKERVVQLAVGFAVGPLKRDPQFAMRVFDFVLMVKCPPFPQHSTYTDALTTLQVFAVHQLQRLAMRFADHLITIFEIVERKVLMVSDEASMTQEIKARYTAVLFVILHRAKHVDASNRLMRLEHYISPLVAQWQDGALNQSLLSLTGFTAILGLSGLDQYLTHRSAQDLKDWSSCPLDEEGRAIQAGMQSASDRLPLRATKHVFNVSVEKLEPGSDAYEIANHVWERHIPVILKATLQLIQQAQAFYNPDNWHNLDSALKPSVRKIFTDRFWQVGISQGTRDDFYANVGGTRATLEGLASSVRAAVRAIREAAYRIIFCMSRLGPSFYGIPDLSAALARALFQDACALSPHQMALLMDVIRPIIQDCPAEYRAQFIPQMVSSLFEKVDQKTSSEWDRIEQQTAQATNDTELASEMKDESVLRQLTMSAVMLVVELLEPAQAVLPTDVTAPHSERSEDGSVRGFILSSPQVLKPLILFCTHALRMRDTRACTLITKVLRTIVGDFSGDTMLASEVREFISTEVLKACITSLNDPYFVDMQKEFAHLIAHICVTYSSKTGTPQQILSSLPGMTTDKVDRAIQQLFQARISGRQQRAIVLELLQSIRGIGLHEQGRLPKQDPAKLRSVMQQKYLTDDMEGMMLKTTEDVSNLDGIAEMFS